MHLAWFSNAMCCAFQALENKPSSIFWTSLGRSLEKCARDTAKSKASAENRRRAHKHRFNVSPANLGFWLPEIATTFP